MKWSSWLTMAIYKFLEKLVKEDIITEEQKMKAGIILISQYLPAENRRN